MHLTAMRWPLQHLLSAAARPGDLHSVQASVATASQGFYTITMKLFIFHEINIYFKTRVSINSFPLKFQ
jgi:hypothetical protein